MQKLRRLLLSFIAGRNLKPCLMSISQELSVYAWLIYCTLPFASIETPIVGTVLEISPEKRR